jgi:uncharacterized iron-regulated protein
MSDPSPVARMRAALAALAAALLAGLAAAPGCMTFRRADPDLVDARAGRDGDRAAMHADLASVPMVFVGESHTHPEHHALQLEILRAFDARRRGPLLLGMEMFERPMQPVLDRWNRGELDEAAFVRESGWYERWGYDWSLYRDILRFARDRGIPVVALNAPREIVRAVGRTGIDGIPPWMRARLPEVVDTGVESHRRAIRGIFSGHPGMEMDDERFDRFYAAQVTWDETMADATALALEAAGPGATIVVLAGGMHVKGFHAIPERARRRNGLDYRTVLPLERDQAPPEGIRRGPGRDADWILLTAPLEEAPPLRLGVALRGGDALVKSVAPGFPAAAAGLREGDRLLEARGRAIADGVDLRLALEGARAGERVVVRYERDGAALATEVVLVPPPPPPAPPPAAPVAPAAPAPSGGGR